MPKKIAILVLFICFLSSAQIHFENSRIGIFISKTSFDQHWGVTQMSAHGWGGAVNLAGIPYSTFFVEDLESVENLSDFDCLVFTQCTYLTNKSYETLVKVLEKYLNNGGNLIIDGLLGYYDESTKERNHSALDKLLGISYVGFYGGPDFRIKVQNNNHFITRNFGPGQFITQHLAGGLNIQKFEDSSGLLLQLTDESEVFPYLSVSEKSKSKIVLINDFGTWSSLPSIFRNEQPRVFYNNYVFNILIETLYWTVYGNVSGPFPSLQVSNADLTAIIRLDADASGNLNAQIQTINYLIDIAKETGVVPLYAWVSSTAAKSGWQDIAPLGKKLESVGGQIGTHSKFHNIDQEMNDLRWKEELDDAIKEIEFNMSDYGYDIGKVDCFINPGNTIHMSDYHQVAKRFGFYMTHGFEQDMPIGFGNFTWYNEEQKDFVILENTPSPDYQWFYDPTWSYTTQQITAYQESIFDHLLNVVQRGVIFNQMWHDYSITSQPQYGKDRIVNKNNLAMYDAIKAKFKNTDIYAPEPEDLRNKICIMAQADYSWSVSENEIIMKLDLSNVGPDSALFYTGGMGIKINNTSKFINKVTINGEEHLAFDDDVVILPNLSDDEAEIKIILGNTEPEEPRLSYISKRLINIEKENDDLSFNLVTKCMAKFNLEFEGNYVLLNADGFTTTEKLQNEIRGYVNTDRNVILKKLKTSPINFTASTIKILDIAESGSKIELKMAGRINKDNNILKFSSKNPVKGLSIGDTKLNVVPDKENYTVILPPQIGESVLTIYLK